MPKNCCHCSALCWTCVATLASLLICHAARHMESLESLSPAAYRKTVVTAVEWAFSGYMQHAWGHDSLKPLSRKGEDDLGGLGATIIDSLDTLLLVGLDTHPDFRRAAAWAFNASYEHPTCLSLFETNIRVLGGLLSAGDLSGDPLYYEKAADLADRLLPAFEVPTGLPCNIVCLPRAVSKSCSSVNLAEIGTFGVEFVALSARTGNPAYQDAAETIFQTLLTTFPGQGLLPQNIHQQQPNKMLEDNSRPAYSTGGDAFSYEYLPQYIEQQQQNKMPEVNPKPVYTTDGGADSYYEYQPYYTEQQQPNKTLEENPRPVYTMGGGADGYYEYLPQYIPQQQMNDTQEDNPRPSYAMDGGLDRYYEFLPQYVEQKQPNKTLKDKLMPVYTMGGGADNYFEYLPKYTLGAGADSYYEYLLKMWLLSGCQEERYRAQWELVANETLEWLVISPPGSPNISFLGRATVMDGITTHEPVQEHLACFFAGNLALGVLTGAVLGAMRERYVQAAAALTHGCYQMYNTSASGLSPDEVWVNEETGDLWASRVNNAQRPEVIESIFYMWRLTHDPKYRDWGWAMFTAFQEHERVDTGGYSGAVDVNQKKLQLDDKQQSFFIAETLKYFWLLFSADSVLPLNEWVLNTEAHPVKAQPGCPLLPLYPTQQHLASLQP